MRLGLRGRWELRARLVLRLREVEVVLGLETSFAVGVVGLGGLLAGWRKRDSGYLMFNV